MKDPVMWVGETLSHLFVTDDGSLPDIYVEPLTPSEIKRIYDWIRSVAELPDEAGVWSIEKQQDVLLKEVDDPIIKLYDGKIELFRHLLINLSIDGTAIPGLSVFVHKDELSFDYRMGPEWEPRKILALMKFLMHIQKMAPNAQIFQAWEGMYDSPNDEFATAFQEFVSNKFMR